MAHKGFKVIDSDMHLIEPCDLWQTYMDDKYKEFAPVGVNNTAWNQDPRVHPRLFGVVTSGKAANHASRRQVRLVLRSDRTYEGSRP